jgi:hypothetical protein
MTTSQENKLRMYNTVVACLLEHDDAVSGIPAFATLSRDFAALVDRIRSARVEIATATAGKTALKYDARDLLIEEMLPVANALACYAHGTGKQDLKSENTMTETSLRQMRENALIDVAGIVLRRAGDHAAAIEPYGVTAERIASVTKALATFVAAMNGRETGTAARVGARESIVQLYDEADDMLGESIDRMMELFRASHPTFYEKYFVARYIRLLGIRHRAPQEAAPAAGADATPASVS